MASPSSIMPLLNETNFSDDSEKKYSSLMESAASSLADVFILSEYDTKKVLNVANSTLYIFIQREAE